MSRETFMKELEYLLQDIPDEEKEEALAYYRDYLEEAGDENEEQVIREFGSPERVAAIIRSDLDGNLEKRRRVYRIWVSGRAFPGTELPGC